jgi:hypothetical protein
MKTGADALGTAETESGRANRVNGTYALGTTENEARSVKLENWRRRHRYRRKRVWGTQNVKMGRDALETTENESGSAQRENGT